MPIDPRIFDRLKTFDDYNKLEQEFQARKAAAAQAAQMQALQSQALQQQMEMAPQKLKAMQDQQVFENQLARDKLNEELRHNRASEANIAARIAASQPYVDPDTGEIVEQPKPAKPLPINALNGLQENRQNLRRADQALTLAEGKNIVNDDGSIRVGDTNATGFKSYLPDWALNRADPKGVDTRAAIADLGSLIIHDRSGAAVTASESPRLKPFIPLATDDNATVKKKLARFKNEYANMVNEMESDLQETGYKVPGLGRKQNNAGWTVEVIE